MIKEIPSLTLLLQVMTLYHSSSYLYRFLFDLSPLYSRNRWMFIDVSTPLFLTETIVYTFLSPYPAFLNNYTKLALIFHSLPATFICVYWISFSLWLLKMLASCLEFYGLPSIFWIPSQHGRYLHAMKCWNRSSGQ